MRLSLLKLKFIEILECQKCHYCFLLSLFCGIASELCRVDFIKSSELTTEFVSSGKMVRLK